MANAEKLFLRHQAREYRQEDNSGIGFDRLPYDERLKNLFADATIDGFSPNERRVRVQDGVVAIFDADIILRVQTRILVAQAPEIALAQTNSIKIPEIDPKIDKGMDGGRLRNSWEVYWTITRRMDPANFVDIFNRGPQGDTILPLDQIIARDFQLRGPFNMQDLLVQANLCPPGYRAIAADLTRRSPEPVLVEA